MKEGFVYIIGSKGKVLYVGVTNNIERRVREHKQKVNKGFSQRYNCNRLYYWERYPSIVMAIEREKQIKRWRREKKVLLIEQMNPEWHDLSEDWD